MPSFKDSNGREWTVSITVDALRRVRSLIDVDLTQLVEDPSAAPAAGEKPAMPLLTRLELDVMLRCDVLYALVKPQADQAGISDEQFGQALGGDALRNGSAAMMDGLADFFRGLGRRYIVKAIEAQQKLMQRAAEAAETRVDAIDIDRVVASTFGNSSTAVPESPASTPAP